MRSTRGNREQLCKPLQKGGVCKLSTCTGRGSALLLHLVGEREFEGKYGSQERPIMQLEQLWATEKMGEQLDHRRQHRAMHMGSLKGEQQAGHHRWGVQQRPKPSSRRCSRGHGGVSSFASHAATVASMS